MNEILNFDEFYLSLNSLSLFGRSGINFGNKANINGMEIVTKTCEWWTPKLK
jgi:hypothetical protein